MISIDKEKLNKSINEAYSNQTEKVKQLLESAKKNLADQKQCPYDYKTNKELANKIYTVSRVVTKRKEKENRVENNINSKFEEMNQKLEINSKHLDFIFENVANSDRNKERLLEDILENQEEFIFEVKQGIKETQEENLKNKELALNSIDKMQKQIEEINLENTQKIIDKQEEAKSNFIKTQIEAENKIIKSQIKVQNKLLNSQARAMQRILAIEQEREEKIICGQNQVKEEIIERHNKLEESLLDANSNSEKNILNAQKQVEKKILISEVKMEEKLQQIQRENEEKLHQIKQEIIQSYQKENKHSINMLLEERNAYLKELEEKDKEIRELNYKIYKYEEKLEKEIAKRERLNIFTLLFRKQELEEEELKYTSQILNYVY